MMLSKRAKNDRVPQTKALLPALNKKGAIEETPKRSMLQGASRARNTAGQKPPWVPSGKTGVVSVQATPENPILDATRSQTSNLVAQLAFEHHQSRLQSLGSLETTMYNAAPGAADPNFTSVCASLPGTPQLVRPQTKTGRVYVSLDSPGMGAAPADARMNRAQVGKQYRESYRAQQIKKNQTGFIPATYHANVSLPVARQIDADSVPQSGSGLKKGELRRRDQQSDLAKYKASHGILPPSFDALAATTEPGTERLAVGRRDDRRILKGVYEPHTIVHPSELLTKSERIVAPRAAHSTQAKEDRDAFVRERMEKARAAAKLARVKAGGQSKVSR